MLFTTPFSSSLYLLTVCNICHWEKKKCTENRKLQESMSEQKSQKNSSIYTKLFFFLLLLFVIERGTNKSQGSVVLKQNKAVPLGLWNNRGDLIHSTLCLSFILKLNAQMLRLFFGRNDCGHLLHIFPFLGHFHFIKLQSMCFVWGARRVWHILWWSQPLSTLVAQVVRGLDLCVLWKGKKKSLIWVQSSCWFPTPFWK